MTQKELDMAALRASLEESGYPFDYFMKRFENRVLLSRYLDEKVFANAAVKSRLVTGWGATALNTPDIWGSSIALTNIPQRSSIWIQLIY